MPVCIERFVGLYRYALEKWGWLSYTVFVAEVLSLFILPIFLRTMRAPVLVALMKNHNVGVFYIFAARCPTERMYLV